MINKIALYRKARGFSQKEFASLIGVTSGTLSKYESLDFDIREIKQKTINKICELLNVKENQLMEELENEK